LKCVFGGRGVTGVAPAHHSGELIPSRATAQAIIIGAHGRGNKPPRGRGDVGDAGLLRPVTTGWVSFGVVEKSVARVARSFRGFKSYYYAQAHLPWGKNSCRIDGRSRPWKQWLAASSDGQLLAELRILHPGDVWAPSSN